MAKLSLQFDIRGPFITPDPIDDLVIFLRANGYTIASSETASSSEFEFEIVGPDTVGVATTPNEPANSKDDETSGDADEETSDSDLIDDQTDRDTTDSVASMPEKEATIFSGISCDRGGKGQLLSSDLTRLRTRLSAKLVGKIIKVEYEIDTTGHILNADERGFWERETASAERCLRGGPIESIMDLESARAATVRKETLGRGLWAAVILGSVLFVVLMFILR